MSQPPESIAILILAAGLGKRMGGDKPKVLAQSCEGPLLSSVLGCATSLTPDKVVVITGHRSEAVEELVKEHPSFSKERIEFAQQKEQLGTGDAVKAALPNLSEFTGTVVILYGDAPLLRAETVKRLITKHQEEKATLSLISVVTDQAPSYGRILRDPESGRIQGIKEAKDCNEKEFLINEVNSGVYCVDSSFLKPAVEALTNENAQGEYYLTDIIAKGVEEGQLVSTLIINDLSEIQGVNTRAELLEINRFFRQRRISQLLSDGVVIHDPDSLFIDSGVIVKAGAEIGPQVQLLGGTVIEEGVRIEGNALLKDTTIHKGAHLKLGLRAEECTIGENATVGPFAHLRSGTVLGAETKIGNFVETKKAHLAKGAKASHLTYLGDCEIGEEANVGAGTITCNYDGYKKSKTIIGENAFIGSNSSLVAPVTVGDGASVGAGSVITKDVSKDALAVTRADQKEVAGWAKRKREKNK